MFHHPKQSVDGIVRSNAVGFQRDKVTNNKQGGTQRTDDARGALSAALAEAERTAKAMAPGSAERNHWTEVAERLAAIAKPMHAER